MKQLIILLLLSLTATSQNILVPNTNPEAKVLTHELTPNNNELYLSSNKGINAIKVIHNNVEQVFNCHNQALYVHSLRGLKNGKNTIMVFIDEKIIVFSIIVSQPEVENPVEVVETPTKKDVLPPKKVIYTKLPYDLTNKNKFGKQTRAEYRKNNLRPNGKPYN